MELCVNCMEILIRKLIFDDSLNPPLLVLNDLFPVAIGRNISIKSTKAPSNSFSDERN